MLGIKRAKCSRRVWTPDLRITAAPSAFSASTTYKYDALTDCATGAGYCECFCLSFYAISELKSKLTGCFHYARQTVRDQCPRKMERHFSIKSGQPRGMALAIFYPFPNVLQWSGKFNSNRSKWTKSRGGPEYSSLKKPKLNTECLLLSLHKLNENFIMIESYRRKSTNTKLKSQKLLVN